MFRKVVVKLLRIWKKHKILVIILLTVFYIVFLDSNNVIQFVKLLRQVRALESEKKQLIEQIQRDSVKLYLLKTNDKTFEQFAREQYFFHKPGEDVYVLKVKN